MVHNHDYDHQWACHVAVVWKDATLFWGGRVRGCCICDPSLVICHLYGKWIQRKTTGDVPTHTLRTTASVLDDRMLVIGGHDKHRSYEDPIVIYSLDLNTWVWTRGVQMSI